MITHANANTSASLEVKVVHAVGHCWIQWIHEGLGYTGGRQDPKWSANWCILLLVHNSLEPLKGISSSPGDLVLGRWVYVGSA